MRVVVARDEGDIVVSLLDNTGICGRSHVVKQILRIPNQTMGVSHFVCTVQEDVTAETMRTIVEAFAAGLESAGANRVSDYERVGYISGGLRINLSPFFYNN